MTGAPGDRALRIAMFHTRLPQAGRKVGGVEVAVHRLANALVALGRDEVTVVSSTAAPEDARYRSERLLAGYPFFYTRPLPQVFVIPVALNFFDFGRFDVVHLHGDDWFFVRRPTPTVRTLHGSALREAQMATRFHRRAFMYGIYGLEQLSSRICSLPLCIGRDAASIYGAARVVSNGVDPAVFFPGPKAAAPRVLFVGLWAGRKRGQFVYESFLRDVLPRVPGAELVMVSDQCPPHPRVRHERAPDDAALAQLYREAWVFASASTYEGFGIPYVEALASGTTILTTSNTGADEVLGEGRYGIVVEDDVFGATLADLLERAALRAEMEKGGIARAAVYTWESVARRHRELYLEAIANPRRPV